MAELLYGLGRLVFFVCLLAAMATICAPLLLGIDGSSTADVAIIDRAGQLLLVEVVSLVISFVVMAIGWAGMKGKG